MKIIQADPDGAGSLTSPEITYAYDVAGQRIGETDPLGNTTTYEYDGLGRVIEVTAPDPDGAGSQSASVTSFTYDAVGNLLTVTDPLSHVTEYEYDAHDNRTKIIDAELGETTFMYDDAGNLLSLTDPVGNTTTWVYDDLGRTIEETNELNKTRTFEYDAANNLTKRTDRNGRVIEFVYDDLHRRTSELWKNGSTTVRTLSWQYDALGRVINAADSAAEFDYTYDNLGRRTSVLHDLAGLSFDVELLSEYDAAGNRTDLKALVNGTADFWNEYLYDDLHRTTSIEQHGAAGGSTVAEKRIDFTYDAAGKWETITRYANVLGTQLVAESAYTFDDAGRLVSLAHAKGTSVFADYDWTYDAANRITAFTNSVHTGENVTYAYDDTDQLTGADRSGSSNDETYGYDANGNRANTGYATGDGNLLESDGVFDYEYDDEGNRTKRTHIASGDNIEYEWDYRNRLIAMLYKSSTGVLQKKVEYNYDVFGRRTSKDVDDDGNGTVDRGERLIYDQTHAALVYDESGSLKNRNLSVRDHVFATEDALGDVLYGLPDNQGTIHDMVEYNVVAGVTSVANHRQFNAFGKVTSETATSVDYPTAYTGMHLDEDTGLQHHGFRWYDPAAQRWLSQDPSGLAPDTNMFRYVLNSPTNYVDPSGLSAIGHHWIPVQILLEFRDRMSVEAFALAMGTWSGPMDPPHCYGTYGGISHAEYNKIVREELSKFMKNNKIKELTTTQMDDFINKIENGLDHAGKMNKELKAFNDGIRAHRAAFLKGGPGRGFRGDGSIASRCRQGRNYLNGPRFASMALGAILASLAQEALAESIGALDVAGQSSNFKLAMKALAEGNVNQAHDYLFGRLGTGDGGFFAELVDEGHAKAALSFRTWYEKAVEEAQAQVQGAN